MNLNVYECHRCERCKEPRAYGDGDSHNVYCNHNTKLKHRYVKVETTVDAETGVILTERVVL
jgi:hypothetical protein